MGGDQGDKKQRNPLLGCLGVLGLFFVGIVSCGVLTTGDGADSPQVQRKAAESACEDFVRDQLKSPSTAEFTGTSSTGSGPWTVTGEVDSENSFGAMIRASWSCEIRLDGDTFRGRAVITE